MKKALYFVLFNFAILALSLNSPDAVAAGITESGDDGFPGEPSDGPSQPAPTPSPAPTPAPAPTPPIPPKPSPSRPLSTHTDRLIGGAIMFSLGGGAVYSWASMSAASWLMPAVIAATATGSAASLTGVYLNNRVSAQTLAKYPILRRIAGTSDFRLYNIGAVIGFGGCYLALKYLSGNAL